MEGILYIVSTPIGNLEDITYRAERILKEVGLIACEDTRRTKKLLNAYDINTPVISYHSYSTGRKEKLLLEKIESGMNVALVSDSGTPCISDPGNKIVSLCIEKGLKVEAIPGPSAVIAALAASGKMYGSFVFEGFLSPKKAKRKKAVERLLKEDRTVVLYESPHRIEKLIMDIAEVDPKKEVIIARELTKKFEEVIRMESNEMKEHLKENKLKGEITVIF